MNYRLLRHPVPYINESIGNYVLRLCSVNSCKVNQIADLIGFNLRGIDKLYGELKEKHIAKFSEITGIEIKVIEDMTAKRFKYGYYQDYINHTNACVCPKCYSEGDYERIHWKNDLIKVCIDHKIYLVDECPCCKEKITINKLFDGKCDCSLLIRDIKSMKCANEYVLKNQNILYQIFNIKSRVSLIESNMLFSTLLDGDYCKLFCHLQNLTSLYVEDLNNIKIFFENDGGFNRNIIAPWIMSDWPTNLIKFLDVLNYLDVNYINSTPTIKVSSELLYEPLYKEMMDDRFMRIFNPLECLKLRKIYDIIYEYEEIYQPIMKYYYENSSNKEKIKIKMEKYLYLDNYVEFNIAIKIFFSINYNWHVREFVRYYFHIIKFNNKEYLILDEIFDFFNKIYKNCSISFRDINNIRSSYTTFLKRFKRIELVDIIQVQLNGKLNIRFDPIGFHGIESIIYNYDQTEKGLIQLLKNRCDY